MARRKDLGGMSDMDAVERMLYGNVEDDPDLEAELLALQGEIDEDEEIETQINLRPAPSTTRKTTGAGPHRPQTSSLGDIDKLARQISLEVAVEDDDNDPSVDDDDDLLAELNNVLTSDDSIRAGRTGRTAPPPPSNQTKSVPTTSTSSSGTVEILSQRLENYKAAFQLAKQDGDAAKIRRLDRGMKTITDLLKVAKSGKSLNIDDIPPSVPLTAKKDSGPALSPSTPNLHMEPSAADVSPPKFPKTDAQPTKPTSNLRSKTDDATLKVLQNRQDEYKKAAIVAKQRDDKVAALKFFKICKQFDQVIEAIDKGQPVDLSNIPPSPGISSSVPNFETKSEATHLKAYSPPDADDEQLSSVSNPKAVAELCHAPPPPSTILEALLQRLDKYKTTAEKAKEEGDTSKCRRMARIQKQYEDAIKDYRAKKPVNFDELPAPPGFGPIPGVGTSSSQPPTLRQPPQTGSAQGPQRASVPASSSVPGAAASGGDRRASAQSGLKTQTSTTGKQSRQEQQLNFLLERQRQFKLAALSAKKRGDLAAAKNYLRQAMGFDQMIEASQNGLPIDISNVPTPPQMKTVQSTLKPAVVPRSEIGSSVAPGSKEGSVLVDGSREEIYSSLERDLIRQVQVCDQNKEYFTKLGDVPKVSSFEKLGMICKKDLDSLRNGFRHGDPPPRFHYETRTFPSLQCCPDLGADDLELNVVRSLLLKLPTGYEPKDADIFVKYEFGFPKESPQVGKTASVKGTNSPTFNQPVKLKINVKSRHFLLLVKRHGVKLEVYQKGTLFRSDKLLGAAEIKLLPLENKTEVHESLDLVEGRKPIGGKIEVKIRIREPLVNKTIEEIREKWLIIDEFIRIPTGAVVKKRLPRTE